MTTKQKILIGSLVAVVVLGVVALIMYFNRKQAALEAQQQQNQNDNSSSTPTASTLLLQSWDLVLDAIKKKKAAKAGVPDSQVTVTKEEAYDYLQADPSLILA